MSSATKKYEIYNKNSIGLDVIKANSIDALITDPPYGISYQNNYWDKDLPPIKIWQNCFEALKPGAYGLVFSSVRLMHRLMVNLEDVGFNIRDVLFWAYLNGMPKSRDVGLDIDRVLNVESDIIGEYKYVQGYKKGGADNYYTPTPKSRKAPASNLGKKYKGAGTALKPAYEPIILIQKPLATGLSVPQNILKYGTGALNIENSRIPYEEGESKVGHNPHPLGRHPANIIRTQEIDEYDKFFLVPKVRQAAEAFNNHPTLKPVELMNHLVKLTTFEGQKVLDPFMGSGSTGVSCINLEREFIGFEIDKGYFEIAQKRLGSNDINFLQQSLFA